MVLTYTAAQVLKIEITIGRPKTLLLWLCLAIAFVGWMHWPAAPLAATVLTPPIETGGPTADLGARLAAEKDLRDARTAQAMSSREANIVRYQLQLLEEAQAVDPSNTALALQLRQARLELLGLLDDQREAERRVAEALAAFRSDSDSAVVISRRSEARTLAVAFAWPVAPTLGISAHYHDGAYQARFGVAHEGMDIPVLQGTTIVAPADAVVSRVSDRGLGYNSLILSHAGGYATLYGHVSAFLVSEGQTVRAGDPIALSGGSPGSPGAGLLTTGSHLHFEMFKDGEHVDPEMFLPAIR